MGANSGNLSRISDELFGGSPGSIFKQDKGPHRYAARSDHKAPQCGAFQSCDSAPDSCDHAVFRTT